MDRIVLDIEKLRAVPAKQNPNEIPTCEVLVVGGGLGGVAAAEALARRGRTVILTEPTSRLGGQLTAQAVSLPDENSYIERPGGTGTRSYRELREAVRAAYAEKPGIKPGRAQHVGQAWVSRVSGEPDVWEAAIRERLAPLQGLGGIRAILMRHQLVEVRRFRHNGRYHYADFVDLDTGRIVRVAAQYLLDASEFGDALALGGSPWTVGQEARAEHNEPHAPEVARPEWVQSFTYCFAVRWTPERPWKIVEKPAEYDYFKSLGEYTLRYDYSDARGQVYYKVFATVPGAGGPFWTYRRIIAASSFEENPRYAQDLALINWRGNDFHEENPLVPGMRDEGRETRGDAERGRRGEGETRARGDGEMEGRTDAAESPNHRITESPSVPTTQRPNDPTTPPTPSVDEQIRILQRGKAFAQGFLYWLQAECPRDDGGVGYPEMQLAEDVMGSEDGFALHPYIRESRRLLAEFTLNENHLAPDPNDPEKKTGPEFEDAVGIALYAMDIHPAKGEAPFLSRALPYYIPLGSFIPRAGAPNILPAAKNIGATRLAASSARMHPTEWHIGEVAGHLAAFCLERRVEPGAVRNTPELLAAFKAQLVDAGLPITWQGVVQ